MTIKLTNLSKIYNADTPYPVKAVNEVNLAIEQGEFVIVMGPSGSGKTTLLNLISGLDTPSQGSIFIDGNDINELNEHEKIEFRRDHIGFIFQDYSLMPVLTALENVEFILKLQGKSKRECNQTALAYLDAVGLASQVNKFPHQMSGGQQQRVAVARALASKPEFIMADEPTANLDAKSTSDLIDIMLKLNENENTTFIISTHDPRVIQRGKRTILFEDGQITQDTADHE